MGSPLASTAMRRPACSAISFGTEGRSGLGQATRSPAHSTAGSRSSWRGPPISTSAEDSAERPAPESLAQPSAPRPTTDTGMGGGGELTARFLGDGMGKAGGPAAYWPADPGSAPTLRTRPDRPPNTAGAPYGHSGSTLRTLAGAA